MIGKRFGKLKVVQLHQTTVKMVECVCDCGNVTNVIYYNLIKDFKPTRSCGCLQLESAVKHGYFKIPEYRPWKSMLARCYNPKNKDYHNYGGRGITVCDEWKNDFMVFYKDMGTKPSSEHSLDRKRTNENYSKDNCRWATPEEQANNRNTNLVFNYLNKEQTLTQWCCELGLKYHTVRARIQKGMLFEVAVTGDKIVKSSKFTIGNETKTLEEWCNQNNIKYFDLNERLYQGWTVEESLHPVQLKQITFTTSGLEKDNETRTLEQWCELLNLNKNNTYLRILRGEKFVDVVLSL